MTQDGGQAYRFWKIKEMQKIKSKLNLHDIAWMA
jgi:hypothetical protein